MWLLIFLFFVITLVVGWCFFGYFMFICFVGLFHNKEEPELPSVFPAISLVIPCFNEEGQAIAKLENVRALDYPQELLEVVFVDGGSTDKTVELLKSSIKASEPYRVIQSPECGKIKQLNYAIPQLKGGIIVNSDVDAILSPDALRWTIAEFDSSDDVLVVGAFCKPANGIEIERYYWQTQNKGRFLENDASGSSIVIAQCYAFRKDFIKMFPEDVVADDIYVAFLAHIQGGKGIYSRRGETAVETRAPQSYADFLPHKFRKSNAFLRESLRFLYRLPEMPPFFKMMFITRIMQQLFLPWALLLWFISAGALFTISRNDIVILDFLVLLILFILTSRVFSWVKLPGESEKYSMATVIKGYFLTLSIMLATGLSYPFFKQGSVYKRLKGNVL